MLTSTGGYPALWFLAAGVPCVLPCFDFFSNVWWFSVMSVVRESLDQKSLSSSSLDLQYVLHGENPLRISSTVLQVLLQLAPACGWCLCDRVRAPFLVTCSSSCFFAGGASCRHYRFQCWSLGLRRPDQDYNLKMLKDKALVETAVSVFFWHVSTRFNRFKFKSDSRVLWKSVHALHHIRGWGWEHTACSSRFLSGGVMQVAFGLDGLMKLNSLCARVFCVSKLKT